MSKREKSNGRLSVIWVRWLDAYHTGNTEDYNFFDNPDNRGIVVESAGILVKDDSKGVVLTTHAHNPKDEPGDANRCRHTLVIPKAYILAKRKL